MLGGRREQTFILYNHDQQGFVTRCLGLKNIIKGFEQHPSPNIARMKKIKSSFFFSRTTPAEDMKMTTILK